MHALGQPARASHDDEVTHGGDEARHRRRAVECGERAVATDSKLLRHIDAVHGNHEIAELGERPTAVGRRSVWAAGHSTDVAPSCTAIVPSIELAGRTGEVGDGATLSARQHRTLYALVQGFCIRCNERWKRPIAGDIGDDVLRLERTGVLEIRQIGLPGANRNHDRFSLHPVVNNQLRGETVGPYSHGVVATGTGAQTLDALAAGDQLPVAGVVAIHALATLVAAAHSPLALGFERQTGRFHNSSSIAGLILP
jgi:hypothetical protein